MKTTFWPAALVLLTLVGPVGAADSVKPASTNLHDDPRVHEDLITSQELIALGCMGKLKVAPNTSGTYDANTLAKIQDCADSASTDIAAQVLSQYKSGAIEKARIPTYQLQYAALFAKQNNDSVLRVPTEDLINSARAQGKKHYPYVPKQN